MNKKELVTFLEQENINPRYYSIIGLTEPPIDNQCVLSKAGDVWLVYYFERGQTISLKEFDSEDKACHYFLDWISKDPYFRLKEK